MPVELSVVVPSYNEEESIGHLYESIVKNVEPIGIDFEIVFVDDGSRDATFERLRDIARSDPRVVAVRFSRNFGQTPAMAAGIDHAKGRIIVTMDADLQNDPADIPMLLEKMNEGYDLVVGWRINRQDKAISRKLPSIVANWLIGKVTGLPIRDNGCSLKAYRAEVIKKVPLYSDMHRFIPAMTIPYGARIAQVGVRHHARQFGQSKYGLSRIYKVLVDLIAIKTILLFSRNPLTCFAGVGLATALIAAACMGVAMWQAPDQAVPSIVFPTVAVLLGSLSVFLICIGFAIGVVHQTAIPHPAGRKLRTP